MPNQNSTIVLTFDDKPKKWRLVSGLCKISINEWYAGMHWTVRKKIKDAFEIDILSQIAEQKANYDILLNMIKSGGLAVKYLFYFKSRPLDASNCVAMVKIIEDVLLQGNDNYKTVSSIGISSCKAKLNMVEISFECDQYYGINQ